MMFNLRSLLTLIAALILPSAVLSQDLKGVWRTESTERGHIEVEISQCGAALCGTIIRARDPDGVSGPYEHLGRKMIWNMMPTGTKGAWDSGKIWDPRNGRTYNSRMALQNGKLVVTGCMLGICQSQTWLAVR